MSDALFGWVHVSDIHFGHGDAGHGWDQELVMATLRRDLAARPVDVPVDALFVTGDIAFSGAGRSPDEYARAKRWLLEAAEALSIGPERVFLVPGNHDVNRAVDAKNKSAGRLMKALRSRATPEQGVDDALRDPDDRKLLASRMEAYLELAKELGPWAGRDPLPPAVERLAWVHALDGRDGLRVRLVGLNSALLCKDDEDFGQLRLGNEQLAKAFTQDRAPNEVVLALSHHPFRKGWLADEGHADAMLRHNAHVHLSGHVHGAESEEARSGAGGSFVRVTAGAAHNDQLPAWIPQTHGYNWGEIRRGDAGKLAVRIHPRLWSNGRFVVDVHSVPDGASFAEHPLSVALTAPGRVATPTPSAPHTTTPAAPSEPREMGSSAPVPVYLAFAPEDKESLTRFVTRHLVTARRDGILEPWSRAQLLAGEDARAVATERLQHARVIVLLLSPDYLASDELYDHEMLPALALHERRAAHVIPILLRPCDYGSQRFSRITFALGEYGEAPVAVQGAGDPDRRLHEAAQAVRRVVERVRGGATMP